MVAYNMLWKNDFRCTGAGAPEQSVMSIIHDHGQLLYCTACASKSFCPIDRILVVNDMPVCNQERSPNPSKHMRFLVDRILQRHANQSLQRLSDLGRLACRALVRSADHFLSAPMAVGGATSTGQRFEKFSTPGEHQLCLKWNSDICIQSERGGLKLC